MNERARTATDTFPAPDETEFRLDVDDRDGETCRRFTRDGAVEIVLVASERPKDAAGAAGYKYVMLPLGFPNYPVAREHARALDVACKLLETAIADAHAHAGDEIPAYDDGHRHTSRLERFSRATAPSAVCEICMHTLVEDVVAWSRDRGLVGLEHSAVANVFQRRGTILAAIDRVFNQDGGLADD